MRKLNASLTFRLDAEQKALLVAEAKESGLSVSELTRSWLSDQVQLAKALPSIAEEVGEMMRMVDANRAIVARYRDESRGELPLPSTVRNWKKKRKSNTTVIAMTRNEALVHAIDFDLVKCHRNRIT